MFKIYKLIIFLIILNFSFSVKSHAHILHYDKLNRIEFDIYRNNKYIGKHIFSFKKSGDKLTVESEINFVIKKLGIVLYKYHVKGTEIYKNGKLTKFTSKTNQNGKQKHVNIKLKDDNTYIIDGSSYKGGAPEDFIIGTWWNHSIVNAKSQISAVSGRIIEQQVTFLGKEVIKSKDKNYNTLRFNISSVDNKLGKKKKVNTDIWYDEKTLYWVKASFNKMGKWEYKLNLIE